MNLNPFTWSFRAQCATAAAVCASLLGFAFYTQFRDVNPLVPCNLCILQRVSFFTTGVVMLLGALHGPKGAFGRRIYGVLGFLAAGAGVWVAGRHVWMTHLPADKVPSCTAPLDFMVQMSGYFEAVKKVMTGSGECAKIDWTFLGLSMPAWSLTWLIALMLGALYIGFRRR